MRDHFSGPQRAVTVLSVTQILCWGLLIFPPVLTMPFIAAAHGWTLASAMAGFSLALVTSGLLSPTVGGLIDRLGGHRVMASGALAGALGFALMPLAEPFLAYLACWLLIGAAMSATLYDPAFATLTRIFGTNARRQITFVTLAGGFASTVSWPATHLLLEMVGWRGTYWTFAAVMALVVAPLHGFALPRVVADTPPPAAIVDAAIPIVPLKPQGRPFILILIAFAVYAFVQSGITSNYLAMLGRSDLTPSAIVTIGMLIGPAQVASRLIDFVFAGRTHPLWIARGAAALVAIALAMLAVSGLSITVAALFAIAFGLANGVMTIARGALPLVMFGAVGYGRVIGRIARPASFVQASAPFVVALAIGHFSDPAVLASGALAAAIVLACLMGLEVRRTAR